jgi:glutaredoxin
MACERVKELLSHAGVPFTVRDVEDDPGAYDALMAAGFRTVPVTFIGETAVKGFDRAALNAALGLGVPPA